MVAHTLSAPILIGDQFFTEKASLDKLSRGAVDRPLTKHGHSHDTLNSRKAVASVPIVGISQSDQDEFCGRGNVLGLECPVDGGYAQSTSPA
jgi:hypothetical protein